MTNNHFANDSLLQRRKMLQAIGGLGAIGVTGFLGGCGGGSGGTSASNLEPIASSLLTVTPQDQVATYRNVDRIYATRRIAKGSTASSLVSHATSLNNLTYDPGTGLVTLSDYMTKSRTTGLLILKDGEIALERYGMGNTADTLWTSFSVAKSLTSTLIGLALQDGSIASLDDLVKQYLPALSSSEYANCSIRSLLRMTSGVAWIEEYVASGDSDIVRLVEAFSSNQPGAMSELMRTRTRAAPIGEKFNYSTGESYVLGALLAAAVGKNLCEYLAEKIWKPAGMQSEGYWLLDAAGGTEMGGNNFSATLRDYGRLGLFMLSGGAGGSNLPNGWRTLAGQPDNSVTAHGLLYPDYPLGYGYQWWSFPNDPALAPHENAFTAQGIHGQFIYINPTQNVVAVVWSAWSEPWVNELEFETYVLIGTAIATLAA
jgi:CubicO group peptidase (beta-lactamase class C family)